MFLQEDNLITKLNLPEDADFESGAVFLIDKPMHWTSFDVVNKIRFKLKHSLKVKKIKVGHAGTLDPLASGLLILCSGKATKGIDTFQAMDKVYSGSFFLGATTKTYDAESEPDKYFDISGITSEMIYDAVFPFLGEGMQTPPIYSAIKTDGQKAYQLARRGEEIELPKRKINIYDFKITKIDLPNVYFTVHCSKGTYIRSLANDFGKILHAGAYLSSLRREKIGEYSVDQAITVDTAVEFIHSFSREVQ